MKFFTGTFLTAILACVIGVQSWKLDKSCQTPDKQELFTELVKSALDMASVASDSLSTLENPDVQNVAKWMLLPDNQNPTPDLKNIESAQETFNNIIINMATQVNNDDPNTAVGTYDFVLYCDLSRFQKNDKGIWVDSDNDEAVLGSALNQWDDCRSLDATLAYTVNPASGRFSQIQLCPWFVDWAKGQTFKSFKDLSTKAWVIDRVLVPACRINHWIVTEIDVTSVFDKVILHEMTHATGAGSLKDVDNYGGLLTARYGWKRCRELAQENPENDRSPAKNADSLALLGSSIRFITDGDKPKRVTIDGNLEAITQDMNANEKRSIDSARSTELLNQRFLTLGSYLRG